MILKKKKVKGISFFILSIMIASSCGREGSQITGWSYNDPKNGGFEISSNFEQETGPGLILVEGGTFMMGRTEQDVGYNWDNIPRRATVSSFYMDETEVANVHYREYLYWLRRVFGMDFPEIGKKALPDTLVWRSKLAFNEPYIELYLRHPSYTYYPVVGVSWTQAKDFCSWRTDRVNEFILIREGLLDINPNQVADDNFNTDAYLAGQYEGLVIQDLPDLDPNNETRKVRIEDGILLPRYRLPTEAEWEFAALGLIGVSYFERITERRIYPWSGHYVRNPNPKVMGDFMGNFKRGRGDNMGTAGKLNDKGDITTPIYAYWPNDYGLYNMAGNVSEWVMDVYRPLNNEDMDDFRAFRGNVFQTQVRDEEGAIAEKLTEIKYDNDSNILAVPGQIAFRDVNENDDKDLIDRRNYKKADNINYLDGDIMSSVMFATGADAEQEQKDKGKPISQLMYDTEGYDKAPSSIIDDKAMVYKGGNWKDRAYWMSPGTRRFLDKNQSTDFLGFRCAMVRVGSPQGLY